MKILSIDTSSKICSVAILEDTRVIYEKNLDSGLTHSIKLMPMIEEAFLQANLCLNDMNLLACSKGPGSFTGIRIGISTLKAFTDVGNQLALGISSFEGLVYQVPEEGKIACLFDARNDQVYGAVWEHTQEGYVQISPYVADAIDTVLLQWKDLAQQPITFIGDGAILHQDKWSSWKGAKLAPDSMHTAKARFIGLAAYYAVQQEKQNEIAYQLTPLYLRKSQAERMLRKEESK